MKLLAGGIKFLKNIKKSINEGIFDPENEK